VTVSWDHVGDAIERRIEDLGISKVEVARRAGIDPSSLWKARTGRGAELSPAMRARIDRALRWPAGTIDAVHDGDDPPSDVLTDTERLDRVEDELARLTDLVDRLTAQL
jgi:hypothetical protein